MSDAAVYVIANITIEDASKYRQYEKGFFPILKKFGGELLTYDDAPTHFEGVHPRPGRVVILKFPSADQASAWYAEPEYQQLSENRRAGTTLEFLTLVHAIPPRD